MVSTLLTGWKIDIYFNRSVLIEKIVIQQIKHIYPNKTIAHDRQKCSYNDFLIV